MLAFLLTAASSVDQQSWLSRNSTVVVSITAVVFSALVGPSVTAYFLGKRERSKDRRSVLATHREDLRGVLDECAVVFASAIGKLRKVLDASLKGETPPTEPAEFLAAIPSLGQRLRLRLPEGHVVVKEFDNAKLKLLAIPTKVSSQDEFDDAVDDFESSRQKFLEAGRTAVQAPISEGDAY